MAQLGTIAAVFFSLFVATSKSYVPIQSRSASSYRSQNIDRRYFLALTLPVGLSISTKPSIAALPTYDDYLATTPVSKRKIPDSNKSNVREILSVADLQVALKSASDVLEKFDALIDNQDWERILFELKTPALLFVFKPCFGAGPAVKALISSLDDDWINVSQAIGELRDFAFENKIPVFNSVDMKESSELADQTNYFKQFDLTEPRSLLIHAKDAIRNTLTNIS